MVKQVVDFLYATPTRVLFRTMLRWHRGDRNLLWQEINSSMNFWTLGDNQQQRKSDYPFETDIFMPFGVYDYKQQTNTKTQTTTKWTPCK
jgi:hypothetical protein